MNYLSPPTKISGAIAAVAFALAMGGSPQAADDNGSATVNVVAPISISAGTALDFGTVAPGLPGTGNTSFLIDTLGTMTVIGGDGTERLSAAIVSGSLRSAAMETGSTRSMSKKTRS